jgi:hypothetical protein
MGIIRDNPIFWREVTPRWWRQVPRGWRIVLAALALGLAIWLPVRARHADPWIEEVALFLLAVWALSGIVIVVVEVITSFRREARQQTWEGLLLSRLRLEEILFGKILAPVVRTWLVGALFMPFGWCAATHADLAAKYLYHDARIIVVLLAITGFAGAFGAAALAAGMSMRRIVIGQTMNGQLRMLTGGILILFTGYFLYFMPVSYIGYYWFAMINRQNALAILELAILPVVIVITILGGLAIPYCLRDIANRPATGHEVLAQGHI